MRVLGIETSCDETGVALVDAERGLLSHALHSQVDVHRRYGGVVPELASRDHIQRLLPLVNEVLERAGGEAKAQAIAYTAGPGLVGALLVGASLARALAFAWDVPVVPVHHMEGHLLAPMLEPDPPSFPFVALLVSGGHTLLVEVEAVGCYRILGRSLDDAAGEAFDKTAKLLGLPYPGGPALAELAGRGRPGQWDLPRPLLGRPGLDFSFSGLKTAVMVAVRQRPEGRQAGHQARADLARAFEEAVVETLVAKSLQALQATGHKRLVVAGGVGANQRLREAMRRQVEANGGQVYYPSLEFCTDNGAMIAYAGLRRLADAQGPIETMSVRPRWSLDSLSPPAVNESG